MMSRPLHVVAIVAVVVLTACRARPAVEASDPVGTTPPCSIDIDAADKCRGVYPEDAIYGGGDGTLIFNELLKGDLAKEWWSPRLQPGNTGESGNPRVRKRKPFCPAGECADVEQSMHANKTSMSFPDLAALKGAYVIAAIRLNGNNRQAPDEFFRLTFGSAHSNRDRFFLFVAKPLRPGENIPPDSKGNQAVARLEIYGLRKEQNNRHTLERMNPDYRYIRRCHGVTNAGTPDAEFQQCVPHSTGATGAGLFTGLGAPLTEQQDYLDAPAWFTCAAGCCYGDFSF